MTSNASVTVGMIERYHDGRADRRIHAIADGKSLCDSTRAAVHSYEGTASSVTCKRCSTRLAAPSTEGR